MRVRLSFRALVGTRKEVIGQIQVCDTHLRRTNLPKKLSDFFHMSSVLQAELRSAGSQSMPYGALDLNHGGVWNSIDGEMLTVLTLKIGYDFIELPPSPPSSSRDERVGGGVRMIA
jgi:hypothetical protein